MLACSASSASVRQLKRRGRPWLLVVGDVASSVTTPPVARECYLLSAVCEHTDLRSAVRRTQARGVETRAESRQLRRRCWYSTYTARRPCAVRRGANTRHTGKQPRLTSLHSVQFDGRLCSAQRASLRRVRRTCKNTSRTPSDLATTVARSPQSPALAHALARSTCFGGAGCSYSVPHSLATAAR